MLCFVKESARNHQLVMTVLPLFSCGLFTLTSDLNFDLRIMLKEETRIELLMKLVMMMRMTTTEIIQRRHTDCSGNITIDLWLFEQVMAQFILTDFNINMPLCFRFAPVVPQTFNNVSIAEESYMRRYRKTRRI